MSLSGHYREHISVLARVREVPWGLVVLIFGIACIGFVMLFSAAGGSFDPWATRQIVRFTLGLGVLFGVAMVDLRFWLKHAYLIYAGAILLLISVEVIGAGFGGARRWIDLGFLRVQPSEIMKIALVLGLARYFHKLGQEEIGRLTRLIVPLALIALPAALVIRQPDLGTAGMLVIAGVVMMFAAGVRMWVFGGAGAVSLAAIPILWSMLHTYQKKRILTFLNPGERPARRRVSRHPGQDRPRLGRHMGQGLHAGQPSPAQLHPRGADRLHLFDLR